MIDQGKTPNRTFVGKVVSDHMDKTIVVEVEQTISHARLQKVIRRAKKYKVHDEIQQAKLGDVVEIYEGRPKSKTKYMYLMKVLTR
jgi:small subunit ribosomal protein S17